MMTKQWWLVFTLVVSVLASTKIEAQTTGNATVSVQVDQPGAVVSSNLFGIFFEEINDAAKAEFMPRWCVTGPSRVRPTRTFGG